MKVKIMDITLTLTEDMLGTVPKDPEVYRTFIEEKKPAENTEDEYMTVEKVEEKGWTGFHKDDEGIFIYDYMVKGQLKNAGNILKDILKVKALKKKIGDFVFVYPRRIRFGKQDPDGIFERPIRGMTPKGERVFLGRSDVIKAGTKANFRIEILPHTEITSELIMELLKYGERQGLGQFRNGGYGRFTVEASLRE